MSSPLSQRARRFHRIRDDHATETAEDYVEAIAEIVAQQGRCRGSDLARFFDISQVTVTKTIARLEAEGLVQTQLYAPVQLTPRGSQMAADCKKRHELVLQFLLAIGVDEETAYTDAEGMEHHVSPQTLECFSQFVRRSRSEILRDKP